MQDKEFDELFRSKLEDFEVEPSKSLWDNIAAEVVIDRKNRSALPFISIAASVLVLITAGVFFIPKFKQVGDTKPPVTAGVKTGTKPQINIAPVKADAIIKTTEPFHVLAVTVTPQVHRIKQTIKKQNSSLPAVKIEDVNNEQQIAQVALKAAPQNNVVLTPVKPDMNANAVIAQTTFAPTITNEVKLNPVSSLAAQQMPAKTVAAVQPKKHRIRSFGDLINVVVSKVDKRKDKLIEFSNKDDDESLITGINLGIIKVKKEEVIATNK